jgi:hypothetical protein
MSRKTGGLSRGSQQHRRASGPGASRYLWIGGVIVILAFVVSVVLAGGLLKGSGKAKGDIAPDITLATTEGDYRISEQRGSVVVLYYSFPG